MQRWAEMPLRNLVALATQRCIGDIVSMFARQHTYRSRYLGQTLLLLSRMGFIEPRCQVYHRFLGVLDLRNACQYELPLSEIELEVSGRNAHDAAVELAHVCQAVQRVTYTIHFEVVIIEPEDSPPAVRTRGYR